MLTDAFIKLRDSRGVKLLRAFIRSPWYLAINAILMMCAELFSLELPVFYIYLFFILIVFLFDEDMLGVLVLVPCFYLSISAANNPGKHEETLFSDPTQMVHLIFMIGIFAVLFAARLVSCFFSAADEKCPSSFSAFCSFRYRSLRAVFSADIGERIR